jgi:hypothetical protein
LGAPRFLVNRAGDDSYLLDPLFISAPIIRAAPKFSFAMATLGFAAARSDALPEDTGLGFRIQD